MGTVMWGLSVWLLIKLMPLSWAVLVGLTVWQVVARADALVSGPIILSAAAAISGTVLRGQRDLTPALMRRRDPAGVLLDRLLAKRDADGHRQLRAVPGAGQSRNPARRESAS